MCLYLGRTPTALQIQKSNNSQMRSMGGDIGASTGGGSTVITSQIVGYAGGMNDKLADRCCSFAALPREGR
jgi:hypothetical protein